MARLQILTPSEVRAFETPPIFTASDRELFFQIPASLHTLLSTQRTVTNRIGLLISIGYFRATKRFFTQSFHPTDIDNMAQRLGCLPGLVDLTAYDAKATTSRHRQLTLIYLGFRPFDETARIALAQEIHTMIRSQQRLKAMFFRAVEILGIFTQRATSGQSRKLDLKYVRLFVGTFSMFQCFSGEVRPPQ